MKSTFTTSLVVLTFATVVGSLAAQAQRTSVGAVVVFAHHELFGNPLAGVEAQRRSRDYGRVAFQWSLEVLAGRAYRIGVPCAGLVSRGACGLERLRDSTRLASASGGAALRLLGTARGHLTIDADWTLAAVKVRTRGLTSGSELNASNVLLGPRVGIDGDWAPMRRVPVALAIDAGVGRLIPILHHGGSDQYSPFDNGFGLVRLAAGVTWRP